MKSVVLSFQHVLAMFGATVLVPFLTGLDPAVALFTAGAGTLFFHLVTGRQVPVFLGSSFAFIPVIKAVGENPNLGLPYATGALLGVGAVYLVMALIVFLIGIDRIKLMFPPIVTGPIIIVIGLILAPVAVNSSATNWTVALITIAAVAVTGIFAWGFFKMLPILVGITVGYVASMVFGLVDFTAVREAAWVGLPSFAAPRFSLEAFSIIVPVALVTMVEHIGDITTNGAVVGKNFFAKPGLHRTLIGDGLATALAGLLGGPANTTYGENTGVLAITKNYNPRLLQGAAAIAIGLALIGKFGALIRTIPEPVMGGVSFILFGMIASIGVKTLVDAKPDLSDMRNSVVVFSILIIGIVSLVGEANPLQFQLTSYATLSGLSLAAVVGILLNGVLELLKPGPTLQPAYKKEVEKPEK